MRDPIVRAAPPTLTEGTIAHPTCDTTGAIRFLSAGGTAPTGSATAANQATQITAEQAILAKLPAIQKTATTTPSIAVANADVATLAAGEKAIIQNLNTTALAVRYGTGASATVFTFMLKGGINVDDGNGGSCVIDDWIGVVSVAAQSGSPRFTASKIS